MFYLWINDGTIEGGSDLLQSDVWTETRFQVEVPEGIYNDFFENRDKYIYENGSIIIDPGYEEEQLILVKQLKYEEAKTKAYEYINNGEALYEFEEGKHIEATDGNIAKLGLSLIQFMLTQDTESTISWNTKEDENVELGLIQLQDIVAGLKQIQEEVWTIKFAGFVAAIEEAQTKEEVDDIEISYSNSGEA